MTTVDLVSKIYAKLDDVVDTAPSMAEETLIAALNAAQNEFASRTLCIFTSSNINAVQDNPWLTLSSGTILLKAASIAGALLRQVTTHELDFGYFDLGGTEEDDQLTNWRIATGTPKFIVDDYGAETVRLVPFPDQVFTVAVEFYALPAQLALAPVVDPTIPEVYQEDLVSGALAYLFGIPDLESMDLGREATYRLAWERKVVIAATQLQTAFRAQGRAIPLPPSQFFLQAGINTLGTGPTSNTEGEG